MSPRNQFEKKEIVFEYVKYYNTKNMNIKPCTLILYTTCTNISKVYKNLH